VAKRIGILKKYQVFWGLTSTSKIPFFLLSPVCTYKSAFLAPIKNQFVMPPASISHSALLMLPLDAIANMGPAVRVNRSKFHVNGSFSEGAGHYAYKEPSSSHDMWYRDPTAQAPKPKRPFLRRSIHSRESTKHSFPKMNYSSFKMMSSLCKKGPLLLPIDPFGTAIQDPYRPWIQDVFLSNDRAHVHVLARNRQQCHMGKNHLHKMKYWEGQLVLFQHEASKQLVDTKDYNKDDTVQYRLCSHEEANSNALETQF
jgi:hypothetical protein